MKTEQQLIDGLRKRKIRIMGFSIALLVSAIPLLLAVKTYEHGISVLHALGETHPDTTITPEAFMQTIPEAFSRYTEMAITISRTYALGILMAALCGLFLGMLIIEITGQNKDRALIRMWDEIQELKKKVEP